MAAMQGDRHRGRPTTGSGSEVLRYAGAAGLAVAAMLGVAALEPVGGPGLSVAVAYAAIAVGACLGGTGPGLLATGLSAAGLALGALPPAPVVLLAFVLGAVGLSLLAGRLVQAGRRAEVAQTVLWKELIDRQVAEARLAAAKTELERRLGEREELLAREQAARSDAQRRRREIQLLADLSRGINESLDVDRMLPALAIAARDVTRADGVRIALRDAESGAMAFRYSTPSGDAPPVTAEERDRPRLVVPIRIGEQVEGMICAERTGDRPFTEQELRSLRRLARDAGIAIRNAQLLAGEQSARAEAEAASRAKDEFLAMLGHELRNPLGAISNANRVLHQIGEQSARLQRIIGRQTQHLGRLVDDLLDISRLTTGKIALDPRPVDLKKVVGDTLATLLEDGTAGRHEIVLDGGPVVVQGDATRLEQVARNLLDNAIKYTPPRGRITVTVRAEGDEAVLRVRDTGAGIPPDVLPRIFDLFVQEERSLDRSMGGLGLGLSLVKRLVALHGGTVSASSPGPDLGSEFVVRLPLLLDVPVPMALASAPSPGPSRDILVIEDNRDVREGLRMLLESWGHRVVEAADGQAGVEAALASPPGIALVDVGLPGLDGYAVARAIRAGTGAPRVFLVAVTGYGQPEDERRSREAGFDAHLVKPVDPDDLMRVLAEAPPES
jgi:signal transduction histidine kinase/CheY-like chemotaxis protein